MVREPQRRAATPAAPAVVLPAVDEGVLAVRVRVRVRGRVRVRAMVRVRVTIRARTRAQARARARIRVRARVRVRVRLRLWLWLRVRPNLGARQHHLARHVRGTTQRAPARLIRGVG